MASILKWVLGYSPIGEWRELPPMKTKRYGFDAITLGEDTIVVLGGHDGTSEVDSVEMYNLDPSNNPIPPMRCRRHACVAVTLRGYGDASDCIMVVGGHDGQASLETAEWYNPRINSRLEGTWGELPPMRTGSRYDCAGAVIGDSLLVAGGHNGRDCTNSVELFDASANRWECLPSMREKRFQCAAVSVGRRMYVIGGCNGKSSMGTCEVYDHTTGHWTDLPPMSCKRKGCAAVALNNFIFVFGGHDDRTSLNTAEMYDVLEGRSGKWTLLPMMKYKRFGCAATVVKDRIFIMGGFDGSNWLDSVEQFACKIATGATTSDANDVHTVEPSVHLADEEIPNELICPITGDLMKDPVVTSDGHSFEREAIEEWFSKFGANESPRSPKTNTLVSRKLFPNHNLRSMCRNFSEKEGKKMYR